MIDYRQIGFGPSKNGPIPIEKWADMACVEPHLPSLERFVVANLWRLRQHPVGDDPARPPHTICLAEEAPLEFGQALENLIMQGVVSPHGRYAGVLHYALTEAGVRHCERTDEDIAGYWRELTYLRENRAAAEEG